MKTVCLWCELGYNVAIGDECTHGEDRPEVRFDDNGQPVSWRITLNRYQRDNLAWLFAAIGWQNYNEQVEPFHFANTGDWSGEIPQLLSIPGRKWTEIYKPIADWNDKEGDRANITLEQLRESIKNWRKNEKG